MARRGGLDILSPRTKPSSCSSSVSRGWDSATQHLFHPPPLPEHLGLSCGLTAFCTAVRQTGSQSQSGSTNSRTCSMTFSLVTQLGLPPLPPPFRAASLGPAAQRCCRQLHQGCPAQPCPAARVGLLQAGIEQSLQEVTATLCNVWG